MCLLHLLPVLLNTFSSLKLFIFSHLWISCFGVNKMRVSCLGIDVAFGVIGSIIWLNVDYSNIWHRLTTKMRIVIWAMKPCSLRCFTEFFLSGTNGVSCLDISTQIWDRVEAAGSKKARIVFYVWFFSWCWRRSVKLAALHINQLCSCMFSFSFFGKWNVYSKNGRGRQCARHGIVQTWFFICWLVWPWFSWA